MFLTHEHDDKQIRPVRICLCFDEEFLYFLDICINMDNIRPFHCI